MRDMQPAFLEPAALEELLGRDDVRVLDCSWFAPASVETDPPNAAAVEFARTRLPGAAFFDHDRARDAGARMPHALPSAATFAAHCRALAVARDDLVVLYDSTPGGLSGGAAAAWLVFALHGHPRVALLAGGLARWVSEGRALVHGATATVAPEQRAPYAGAVEDESSQLRVDDVLNNLRTQRTQLIDCQPKEAYDGERRAQLFVPVDGRWVEFTEHRAGHIPGARHVSAASVQRDSGELLAHAALREVFASAGVDITLPVAVAGATTFDAAPVVLALRALGAPTAVVRDGVVAWSTHEGGTLPLVGARAVAAAAALPPPLPPPHATDELPPRPPPLSPPPQRPSRVILWAVTRGRSTAFERAVAQRADATVMHELLTEPWLRAHNPTNYARLADGQHRQNVRASGCTYEAMVEVMRADYAHTARPFFFSKELSCYFDSSAFDDAALRDFDHVFLVRDPHATLASFYRVGVKGAATLTTSYYDDREAGFVESLALYRRVRRAGARTLVLDADDELMRDPELTLRRFCTFARVPFDARMLAWERAAPPEWSKFRGWHDDVAMSTRFDATLGGARSKVTVPAAVFAAADALTPVYKALHWRAERAEGGAPARPVLARVEGERGSEAHLVCAHDDDVRGEASLALLLAAHLCDELSCFALDAPPRDTEPAAAPTDEIAAARASIATALARCPDLLDRPIVLAGTAAALRCTFGALRDAWERGEVCVLRLILISADGAGDSAAGALATTLKLCDADPNGSAAPPISVVDARPLCAAVTGTNVSAACADALGAAATNVTYPNQGDSASDDALAHVRAAIANDLDRARGMAEAEFDSYNAEQPTPRERFVPWRAALDAALAAAPAGAAALIDGSVGTLSLLEVHALATRAAAQISERLAKRDEGELAASPEEVGVDGARARDGACVAIYLERSAACCWVALGALLARAKFVDVAAWSKPSDVKRVLDVVAPDVIVTSRELAPNVPSALAGRVLTLDDLAPAPKCTGLNTAGPPRFQLSPISTSSEVRSSCETTFCPVSSEALNHRLLRPSGVVNRGGRR